MDTKTRSKIANQTRRDYIMASKKKGMLTKMRSQIKASPLNDQIEKDNDEDGSDSGDDQYVLRISADENKVIKKRQIPATTKEQEKLLKMQRSIEKMKLQQMMLAQQQQNEQEEFVEKPRGRKKKVEEETISQPVPQLPPQQYYQQPMYPPQYYQNGPYYPPSQPVDVKRPPNPHAAMLKQRICEF